MNNPSDIGMIGLGVMGKNLALNFARHGYGVAAWDRDADARQRLQADHATGIVVETSLSSLVAALSAPRMIMLMVNAGAAIDDVIDQLLPLLETGDIIIDGGNSHYADTERRVASSAGHGIHFIGAGISGGELGALSGPSIMPGGSADAWPTVQPLFESIAARVHNAPCCAWIGAGGAGHFVKMVHNGIEYADMQLIAEAYHLLRDGLGMGDDDMHRVFADWNSGELAGYLMEITAAILAFRENGEPLLPHILDSAGQKGTGKWTVGAALDMGVPLGMIAEAVFARCLSSRKTERVHAAGVLAGPDPAFQADTGAMVKAIGDALLAAKIVSYAQGFALLHQASSDRHWSLDFGRVARLWRGGCIIRSAFLDDISQAFANDPALPNLMLDGHFKARLLDAQAGWREVIATAARHGIPCPALASALNYFDAYRTATLPANLLQAQRDYFGAHTYERTDMPRGEFFHTDWSKRDD